MCGNIPKTFLPAWLYDASTFERPTHRNPGGRLVVDVGEDREGRGLCGVNDP